MFLLQESTDILYVEVNNQSVVEPASSIRCQQNTKYMNKRHDWNWLKTS